MSASVTNVELPMAKKINVLGVVLDRRPTFDKHVLVVTRLQNFHAQAMRQIS